jgi:Protein of unknown function (DUF2927)
MRSIWILTIGLVLVILVCGCTSTAPSSQPTATSTIVTGTTKVPAPPKVTSSETTAIPEVIPESTITQTLYSTNDIYKHFIDIAFSPDYPSINKWNKELVHVAISGNYDSNDIKTINNFLQLFNSYSSTTKLPKEVQQGQTLGDIVLYFLPESSLNNINLDTSWKISKNPENGTINFIYKTNHFQYGVSTHTVYINSDLKGNARTHWILRSLLFELGFPGETGTYPDSIFYSESDTPTSLSKIDLKALELMYGTKISNGMSLNKVRDLLLIDSSGSTPIASPVLSTPNLRDTSAQSAAPTHTPVQESTTSASAETVPSPAAPPESLTGPLSIAIAVLFVISIGIGVYAWKKW